jgi:hypothetical protein
MADFDVWNFLSGVIGAVLGDGGALLATKYEHHLNAERKRKDDSASLRGFLQALHDEIAVLWDNYFHNMGNVLEALDEGNAHCEEPYWDEERTRSGTRAWRRTSQCNIARCR